MIASLCLCSKYVFAALSESIFAQGLLGSHFGVPGLPASFDYVIAGGGTAGLTIARRLAEDSSIKVAVIEAGDFYEFSNGNFTEIPAYAAEFTGSNPILKNPLLDWYQYTERQVVSIEVENCINWRMKTLISEVQGLADRVMLFPSGKVLGGGSARNFMWYHR